MTSLYTATELATDLQTLGHLGHHATDKARLRGFRKALGFEVPRVGRWLLQVAAQHGIGDAELTGWILRGAHRPEPAGLPSVLTAGKGVGPDALPSALYGGLMRLGQTPNGELWAADMHRKTMPVYVLDPHPDGLRVSWKRRFERLDDFVFFAVKAALCQRDRITVEEFIDLARERGVRPEEMLPDSLEDERAVIQRLGLRKAKKVPPIANRFLWLDVYLSRAYLVSASPAEVARLYVDHARLHELREESEKMNADPSVAAFWLFRHTLFSDEAGYKRVLLKAGKPRHPVVAAADAACKAWAQSKVREQSRLVLKKAIEARMGRR